MNNKKIQKKVQNFYQLCSFVDPQFHIVVSTSQISHNQFAISISSQIRQSYASNYRVKRYLIIQQLKKYFVNTKLSTYEEKE